MITASNKPDCINSKSHCIFLSFKQANRISEASTRTDLSIEPQHNRFYQIHQQGTDLSIEPQHNRFYYKHEHNRFINCVDGIPYSLSKARCLFVLTSSGYIIAQFIEPKKGSLEEKSKQWGNKCSPDPFCQHLFTYTQL